MTVAGSTERQIVSSGNTTSRGTDGLDSLKPHLVTTIEETSVTVKGETKKQVEKHKYVFDWK